MSKMKSILIGLAAAMGSIAQDKQLSSYHGDTDDQEFRIREAMKNKKTKPRKK
jgi:hypothetical protein